jgi:hypothetical protein
MQKIFPILIITLITCFFSNCKKGENDPEISFRTRKARVVGDWRVETAHFTYDYMNLKTAEHYDEIYDVKGSSYEASRSTLTAIDYFSGAYVMNVSFDKKGGFTLKETFLGKILEATGKWDFSSGVGEEKKKESIQMFITNVTSDKTSAHFFNHESTVFKYRIKELRNKKMVIVAEGMRYAEHQGTTITIQTEYILIQ